MERKREKMKEKGRRWKIKRICKKKGRRQMKTEDGRKREKTEDKGRRWKKKGKRRKKTGRS